MLANQNIWKNCITNSSNKRSFLNLIIRSGKIWQSLDITCHQSEISKSQGLLLTVKWSILSVKLKILSSLLTKKKPLPKEKRKRNSFKRLLLFEFKKKRNMPKKKRHNSTINQKNLKNKTRKWRFLIAQNSLSKGLTKVQKGQLSMQLRNCKGR